MSTLEKKDWLQIGLDALRDDGPSGLTLEALTRRAKRTKGSFYHHFKDQQAFIRDMLALWAEQSPLDQAENPFHLLDPALEAAIRRLPGEETARVIAETDEARIDTLAGFHLDPTLPVARSYARIHYAAWIGLVTLPNQQPGEIGPLLTLLTRMIEAHWNE